MTDASEVLVAPGTDRGRVMRVLDHFNSSLRIRIYALIAIAAIASIGAIAVADSGGDEAARDLAAREMQARTAAAAQRVAVQVAGIHASLGVADLLVEPGDNLRALCERMQADQRHVYQRLFVLSPQGDLLCSTVPDVRNQPDAFRQASYFRFALTTGEDQVGGPLVGPFTGRLSLGFAHAIGTGANTVGVVVAGMDVADVVQPAKAVAGSERLIVVGRDGEHFELGQAETPVLPTVVEDAVAKALTTGAPCAALTVDRTVWSCSRVAEHALVLVSAQPERSVFAAAFDASAHQAYRAAAVVVLAVVAAFANDLLFLRRIRRAHQGAGLGLLDASYTTRRDEIDELHEWVQTSGETIRRFELDAVTSPHRRHEAERTLLGLMTEAVELRYPFMRDHGDRVGRYARQVGARLGIPSADLDLLEFVARVHDVGMLSVPDAMLLKAGPLEPIEAAQMQLHAPRGGETLRRMRSLPASLASAVLYHHERWDGGGYPDGLAGTEIPLWSRIIAVVDSYDAMTEARPHRLRALTHDEAVAALRAGAGTQWDAAVVGALLDVFAAGHVDAKPSPVEDLASGGA